MAERLPYDYEGQAAYREPGRDVWGEGNLHEPRRSGAVLLHDAMNNAYYRGDPRGHVHPGRPYDYAGVTHMTDYAAQHRHGPLVPGAPGALELGRGFRGYRGDVHMDDVMMYPERNIHVLRGTPINPDERARAILAPYMPEFITLRDRSPKPKPEGRPGGGKPGGERKKKAPPQGDFSKTQMPPTQYGYDYREMNANPETRRLTPTAAYRGAAQWPYERASTEPGAPNEVQGPFRPVPDSSAKSQDEQADDLNTYLKKLNPPESKNQENAERARVAEEHYHQWRDAGYSHEEAMRMLKGTTPIRS